MTPPTATVPIFSNLKKSPISTFLPFAMASAPWMKFGLQERDQDDQITNADSAAKQEERQEDVPPEVEIVPVSWLIVTVACCC